jgi:RHS repeat-associated protein
MAAFENGGTAIVSYTFDPSGNITNRALDNGTSTVYTVDQVNRDTAVVHNLLPTGTTKRFDYAYNAVNDVSAVERDGNTSDGDGYLYDLTQQITGYQQHGTVNLAAGTVTSPQINTTLTFDGCGNQRSKNGVAFTPPNNMNQPTDPGITYDLNGNLLTYAGYIYKYDAQNRLRTVLNESNLKIAEFFYDGLNRQVARSIITVNLPSLPVTTNTFSVWDGDWAILEEYGANNVLTQKYLQGYHGLVKTFVGTPVYYYQDELGSTSHVASATGTLLEYYKYDLYGKPKFFDALNNQLSTTNYSVKDLFTGQRWVSEIGLYDDRNRFMSSDLGRFLQPDPIGFKGDGSNLYRYVGNDWANKTDPMGTCIDGALSRQSLSWQSPCSC